MGEMLALSQTSLLSRPHLQFYSSRHEQLSVHCSQSSVAVTSPMCLLSKRLARCPITCAVQKRSFWMIRTGVVSESKLPPTTFTVDSAGEGIDILPDSGGSNDNLGGPSGSGGGGGGNGSNRDDSEDGSNGSEDRNGSGEKKGMSMSQKLTLGYAVLVGIGGAMGYIKGGSQKSLIAGGLSAALLIYVYTLLPAKPVLASSLGFGLSAALLGVMGSRFEKSGKIFPAGIVSFVSLVMSGGYLHGILRSLH